MTDSFDLAFDLRIPWEWLIALGAGAAIAAAAALATRARGAILRALALTALWLALADPTVTRERREALPDIAVAVVDESESMGLGRRADQAEEALAALRAAAAEDPSLELRVVRADSADGEGTRLGETLARALADAPPAQRAAAFVITDGAVEDDPETLAALPAGAPVHLMLACWCRASPMRGSGPGGIC